MQKISIVFSTNDKFVSFTSVAIESIKENASNNLYYIYIFHSRLSKNNINNLEKQSNAKVVIKCMDISKEINFNDLYEVDNYTYEIYYRYYAPKILNQYKKIIYLDSDIILLEDIAKLYNENIDNSPIAAILDFKNYVKKANFYFNSGVLVFNVKQFENQQIRNKCLELIKKIHYKLPDQDALNEVCKNSVYLLNPKYNHQVSLAYYHKFKHNVKTKKYKLLFKEEPIIIHFSYITKPNVTICSKYNKDFWKYASKTAYFNQLVDSYLKDPYEILRNSPVDDIYIDLTREGKVRLRRIINVFFYQLASWFLYKLEKGSKKYGNKK